MKLNYKWQLILTIVLTFAGNVLTTVLKHWIWRNLFIVICAVLWIVNPVMINGQEPTPKQRRQIQIIGGGILLLVAVFTRSYTY